MAWLLVGLIVLISAGITLWMAGAIYFDVGNATSNAWMLTITWIGFVVGVFVIWQESRINEIANAAPPDGFGDYLRQELPGYRHYKDAENRSGWPD